MQACLTLTITTACPTPPCCLIDAGTTVCVRKPAQRRLGPGPRGGGFPNKYNKSMEKIELKSPRACVLFVPTSEPRGSPS